MALIKITKDTLNLTLGIILVGVSISAYAVFWGYILDLFEKLFKSGDPFGWTGVIAMITVLYTGLLIYGIFGLIKSVVKKEKKTNKPIKEN